MNQRPEVPKLGEIVLTDLVYFLTIQKNPNFTNPWFLNSPRFIEPISLFPLDSSFCNFSPDFLNQFSFPLDGTSLQFYFRFLEPIFIFPGEIGILLY